MRAALDAGISTFDTADVYANTRAETVLGEALKGERRESLEIFTKVYWPTGPGGNNDAGLSRKHIMESINASLTRLQTDYVDLYQAHRFDPETPLEETMQAFADVVRAGKALYIGVSEWTAEQIRAGHALAEELGVHLVSSQPQYSMLWRVIEAEVVPTCRELGISQIVWSPIAQGVLTGKYQPGQAPPAGSRATDEKGGADMIKRFMKDDILARVQQLRAGRRRARPDHGPARDRLGAAERQRRLGDRRRLPAGAGRRERQGGRRQIPAELMTRIDEALGDTVERDPAQTVANAPAVPPGLTAAGRRLAGRGGGRSGAAAAAAGTGGSACCASARRARRPCVGWSGKLRRMPRRSRITSTTESTTIRTTSTSQSALPRAAAWSLEANDSTRMTSANGRKNSATDRRASTMSRTYRRTGPRSRGGRLLSSPARSAAIGRVRSSRCRSRMRLVGLLAALRRRRRPGDGPSRPRGASGSAGPCRRPWPRGLAADASSAAGGLASSEHGRQRTCGVGAGGRPGDGGNFPPVRASPGGGAGSRVGARARSGPPRRRGLRVR